MMAFQQSKLSEESKRDNATAKNKDLERKLILSEKMIEDLTIKLKRALDSARVGFIFIMIGIIQKADISSIFTLL